MRVASVVLKRITVQRKPSPEHSGEGSFALYPNDEKALGRACNLLLLYQNSFDCMQFLLIKSCVLESFDIVLDL